MEGKTPTEKVYNLGNLVFTLVQQVQGLDVAVNRLMAEDSRAAQALGDVKMTVVRLEEQVGGLQRWKGEMADLRTEVAILRREVDKLEKVKEEWGRRFWMIAAPAVGAVVGWILGYLTGLTALLRSASRPRGGFSAGPALFPHFAFHSGSRPGPGIHGAPASSSARCTGGNSFSISVRSLPSSAANSSLAIAYPCRCVCVGGASE
jgi:hypothetical protein